MLEKDKRRQDYFRIEEIIKETKEDTGIKDPTAKDVLEHICGNVDGWSDSDFVIYKYTGHKKRNLAQRLNTLWVYPMFIATIPLQFLFTGTYGVNRNSKIGRVINLLVKFD